MQLRFDCFLPIFAIMSQRNVLVCPLNWGLGHATRCIPLIRILLEQGCTVYIASDGRPLYLLQQEFPQLTCIQLPGYGITYPKGSRMILKMMLQIPRIFRGISKEHEALEQIVKSYCIDVVISDNRWGLWSAQAYTVFITHQIMIKTPAWLRPFESVLYSLNRFFISRFDECWIPDFLGTPNLSGDLSHKRALPDKTYFIGPLSRFYGMEISKELHPFDVLVILSGPEPQRTIFETVLLDHLKFGNHKAVVVRGVTEHQAEKKIGDSIRVINYATAEQLFDLISAAGIVISRPGYSSVMDMAAMGKQAIFVPTPGQTEQEYLSSVLQEQGLFYSMTQEDFDLEKAIKMSSHFRAETLSHSQNILEMHLNSIYQRLGK